MAAVDRRGHVGFGTSHTDEQRWAQPMNELHCRHIGSSAGRVCQHLLDDLEGDHIRRFTGVGISFDLFCLSCVQNGGGDQLRSVCPACFTHALEDGSWEGIVGAPEIRERPTNLAFDHQTIGPVGPADDPFLDLRPVPHLDSQRWVAVDRAGRLLRLDLDERSAVPLARLDDSRLDWRQRVSLHLSTDGQLATVVNTRGRYGAVVDLETGVVTLTLDRGDYRIEHS